MSYPVASVMSKPSITFKVYCKCSTFYDLRKKTDFTADWKYDLTQKPSLQYIKTHTLWHWLICIWLPCCALKDRLTIFQVCPQMIAGCPCQHWNGFCSLKSFLSFTLAIIRRPLLTQESEWVKSSGYLSVQHSLFVFPPWAGDSRLTWTTVNVSFDLNTIDEYIYSNILQLSESTCWTLIAKRLGCCVKFANPFWRILNCRQHKESIF